MKLILFALTLMLTGCLAPIDVHAIGTPALLIVGGALLVVCVYIMRTDNRDDWLTTWLFWLGITSICIGGIFQ